MNLPMPATGGTWLRHADGSLEEVPPATTPGQLAEMIAAKGASAAVSLTIRTPPAKAPAPGKSPPAPAVKEL